MAFQCNNRHKRRCAKDNQTIAGNLLFVAPPSACRNRIRVHESFDMQDDDYLWDSAISAAASCGSSKTSGLNGCTRYTDRIVRLSDYEERAALGHDGEQRRSWCSTVIGARLERTSEIAHVTRRVWGNNYSLGRLRSSSVPPPPRVSPARVETYEEIRRLAVAWHPSSFRTTFGYLNLSAFCKSGRWPA